MILPVLSISRLVYQKLPYYIGNFCCCGAFPSPFSLCCFAVSVQCAIFWLSSCRHLPVASNDWKKKSCLFCCQALLLLMAWPRQVYLERCHHACHSWTRLPDSVKSIGEILAVQFTSSLPRFDTSDYLMMASSMRYAQTMQLNDDYSFQAIVDFSCFGGKGLAAGCFIRMTTDTVSLLVHYTISGNIVFTVYSISTLCPTIIPDVFIWSL